MRKRTKRKKTGPPAARRKRADASLLASEERFRQLAENIREVFWMTNVAKNEVIYVSPGYQGIWGRTCESLYASPRNWVEAIHHEDRERVLEAALTKQSSGQYHEVYRIHRPDGSIRWIEDRAFPVRDEAGKVFRIVGIADDITERKRVESQLAVLGHAVESTVEPICITDLEDRFTFVNRAFQATYGYTEAEILGKTPRILFSPDNPPSLIREILAQTRSGGWRGEVLDLRKDGTEFPIFLATSPIKDQSGRVLGLIGVAQDISERKRAEEQIRLLADAVQSTQELISITDSENRFTFVNRAFLDAYGYGPEEVLGRTPEFLYSSKNPLGLCQQVFQQTLAGGWKGELLNCRKNGTDFPISLGTSQIKSSDGRILGLVGVAGDISARARAEKRGIAFSQLGYRLSGADTREQAAEIILDIGSELFGWDAGYVDIYSATEDKIIPLLVVDTVGQERRRYPVRKLPSEPSPMLRRVMQHGAELIETTEDSAAALKLVPFGNVDRRAASRMFVPIHARGAVVGLVSIQSYTPRAYAEEDLKTLQTMADICGGALLRIEMTEALREAEAKYRGIFENAAEGIFQTTHDGRYLNANPSLARMFGYPSPEQLISTVTNIEQQTFVSPETAQELKRLLAVQDSVQGFEAERYRKDGSTFWTSINVVKVYDAGGTFRCYEGTTRDITAGKRAQKQSAALSRLGHRLSSATAPAQAANIVLEVASKLFGWDAGFVHLYSKSADEIIPVLTIDTEGGQRMEVRATSFTLDPSPLMRLVMEEGPQLYDRATQIAGAPPFISFGDTSRPSASMMYVPIRAGGDVFGVLSIQSYTCNAYSREDLDLLRTLADYCGDTFRRIEMTEALREAEAKYRGIFENATEGIFQSTPDGRIVAANPALACMFGYQSPEEMMSSITDVNRQMYVSSERRADFKRALESEGSVQGFEAEGYRKDGRKIWLAINARVIRDAGGQTLFYEGAAQDITERKRMEKKVIAFADLAHQLSAATGVAEAARLIMEIAGSLFDWDSGFVHLYSEAEDKILRVLTMDTINGQRVPTPATLRTAEPSPMMRLVMREGPRLINRDGASSALSNLHPFGDPNRRSASMMYAPIRVGDGVVGIMSIQSYTPRAYSEQDLHLLRALADHCGGALQRITGAEALGQAEAKYRSIFENATEGIFQSTPDGHIVGANPALARMFGYHSPKELMSDVAEAQRQLYVSPEGWAEFQRVMDSQGFVHGFEAEIYHRGGGRIWVTINPRVVRDASDLVRFYEGTVQDITRSKETEAILRESERKLRLISENTTDAIFAFDMERRPVYANPALTDLTGYSLAEIQERGFINWIHPDDQGRMLRLWDELYAGKSYSDVEFRLVPKFGQTKWCSSTWGPLFDESGRQIGVQGRERDISFRKELEREVLDISANERRRIGHELHDGLGQYLAGIAFRAKALEQRLSSAGLPQSDDARELVTLMGKAIGQARNLARGMAPVDVEANGLAAALQNLAAETGHFFNTPCFVSCTSSDLQVDAQIGLELYRVAQEAIHNAIKHGEASRIDIKLNFENHRLCLQIVDDGKGFETETATRSGMGLRVMGYRARSIGANLEVASQPGQGAQVRCLVPLAAATTVAGVIAQEGYGYSI